MQLHRHVDHPLRRLGGVKLGHRRLAADPSGPHVLGPGRAVDQQRGRVDLHRHVGDMALHHLQLGQRRAADPARLHPHHRRVQRPTREPQRCRPHRRAEHVQHRHGNLEPLAGPPDQRRPRQPHAVQPQMRQRMRRDHRDPFDDLQPRRIRGHQEGRQPLRPRRLAGTHDDNIDIRNSAVRDIGLLARQHPTVAVARRHRRRVGHIRPRVRLGQGEA